MNYLLLFLVLWAIASAAAGVAVGKHFARREALDARIAPHVASELDERTAVLAWPRRYR